MQFTVFIGSSSEYRLYAEMIQAVLRGVEGVAADGWWDPQVFPAGNSFIQSLEDALMRYDAALMLASPDDLTDQRGEEHWNARGNVLLEYGMFLAARGREKVGLATWFDEVSLPSDLLGVNHIYLVGGSKRKPTQQDLDQFEVDNKLPIRRWVSRAKEARVAEGGLSSIVLQASNIADVFDNFYRDAFKERTDHYDVFLCGGNLFSSFQPVNHGLGKSFESQTIKADIELLSLRGHLFQRLPSETALTLRVLLLNPHNPQISTIEDHRHQRREPTKGSIADKIYSTLYILHKIRNNPRIRDVDVRVTMSPIPFHVNWVQDHSIFVNQYLLGMRSLDSPFAVYRDGEVLHDVYATHLNNFFREGFDAVHIDFDAISGKDRVTVDFDLFKTLLDIFLGRKDAFPGKAKNPFGTQRKLLSNHYDVVACVRKSETTYPVQMEVNLTDICNQRCPWCISENILDKNPRKLDVNDRFGNFLSDFQQKGGKCLAWSGGGEPTTHPEFVKAIDYASKARLEQGLLTNGDYDSSLNDHIGKYMKWVRFSVDTHRPDEYRKQRRANKTSFGRMRDNIECLADRRTVRVGINANVSYWNVQDVDGLYELAKDTKASYLQVRPVLPRPMVENEGDRVLSKADIDRLYLRLVRLEAQTRGTSPEIIVSYDKFEDLKLWDRSNEDPHKNITTYSGCSSHNLFVALNCDGALSVCMYHLFDGRFNFGNIYSHTYEEIWQGKQRQDVVNFCRFLEHGKVGCQVCCKGHEINRILLARESPQRKGQPSPDDFL